MKTYTISFCSAFGLLKSLRSGQECSVSAYKIQLPLDLNDYDKYFEIANPASARCPKSAFPVSSLAREARELASCRNPFHRHVFYFGSLMKSCQLSDSATCFTISFRCLRNRSI
jgi:hypothetical protein